MPSRRETANALFLCALAFGIALCAGALPPAVSKELVSDSAASRDILAYTVLPSEPDGEELVRYDYVGARLPETLAPDENVALRTESSYTRRIAVEREGTPEERVTNQLIAYPEPQFSKSEDGWHYRETATTTKMAFDSARRQNPLAALFWQKAYADSISPFADAGDGFTSAAAAGGGLTNDCATQWTTLHNETVGQGASAVATTFTVQSTTANSSFLSISACNIDRAHLPFDTSSIPSSGSTVTAATLNVYATTKDNTLNDGLDYLTVVQTSQGTHTTLTTTDYDQCGAITSPTEGIATGERKDVTSVTASAYLVFNLNATGLSWIKSAGSASACSATTGITCLGIREGHDTTNTVMSTGTDVSLSSLVTFSSSEQTGTSQDPYLAVTYTYVPPTTRHIYLLGNVYLRGIWLY